MKYKQKVLSKLQVLGQDIPEDSQEYVPENTIKRGSSKKKRGAKIKKSGLVAQKKVYGDTSPKVF